MLCWWAGSAPVLNLDMAASTSSAEATLCLRKDTHFKHEINSFYVKHKIHRYYIYIFTV